MAQRTEILYLAPWVDLGGSDKGTIDWFKSIDRKRWAPSLITTQPSPNRWLHQVEPFAEEIWDLPDLMPGKEFPRFILGFIESRGVQLIHIMNSQLGFDLLPDVACMPNPPTVVVQMHAEEPNRAGYVSYATRRYGNLVDAFSVTSEHLKRAVVEYDIPPSKVEVIHTGVDAKEEFNPARVDPLPRPERSVPRVLWPGRLVEQKDPMLMLDVVEAIQRKGGVFELDVVGDGDLKGAVRSRAGDLNVADLIHWHPPTQELARWYRSADLVLMTSSYEGIPYVIFESLAMGVPVVAPSLPGNRELMDEDSGALVEPRDDANLYAQAVVDLLEDRPRRNSMGERSRLRMLERFSIAEMGRRHDELYERLLSARPAGNERERSEPDTARAAADTETLMQAPELRLPRDPPPERSVGVIVPCHRHGIFLEECVRSIKSQTLAPAEIVVVDDASDDPETIEALDRLERDPELTVLRQSANSGPSAARNRALTELNTSYVLPLDADDQLLPDALERMLARLETAPDDVGFVYPHVQHFGNRTDYVEFPAYNLWLLMEENYCPAPSLFDSRVFEYGGISYPEEIVVGHEDWDLILQLAERGVYGLHADGPTFLYGRRGFSRVNAAEYGPNSFKKEIQRRHPDLYGNRDAIKARWAPAVSVVLLDDESGSWSGSSLSELPRQTCTDHELLARDSPVEGVRTVGGGDGAAEWLQSALREARGRRVCLLTPPAASLLQDRSFVERLIYGFLAGSETIVLAVAAEGTGPALSQLDDTERLSAVPVGFAFERLLGERLPSISIEQGNSLLSDLATGMQIAGDAQWRRVPSHREARKSAGGLQATAESRSLRLDLNCDQGGDRPEVEMRQAICHQPPRLPKLVTDTVRSGARTSSWMPACTQPLCRHIAHHSEHRMISNDRRSPAGYELEFDLGMVQEQPVPGTRRLVYESGDFKLIDDQNRLGDGRDSLGYVEQQPLPMFERLELRELLDSGQWIPVAGAEDPLFDVTRPHSTLGWIEPFPIPPSLVPLHTGPWGVLTLRRLFDERSRRHAYQATAPSTAGPGPSLGSLFERPGEGLIPLRLREDGRLVSDLARPNRASRDPRKIGRWVAGPALGGRSGPPRPGDAAGRLGHLARHYRRRRQSVDDGAVLGWLRQSEARGCRRLFSTTHQVTGDQLVTPYLHEADAAGYMPDGMLGYILNVGATLVPPPPDFAGKPARRQAR